MKENSEQRLDKLTNKIIKATKLNHQVLILLQRLWLKLKDWKR